MIYLFSVSALIGVIRPLLVFNQRRIAGTDSENKYCINVAICALGSVGNYILFVSTNDECDANSHCIQRILRYIILYIGCAF